MRGYKYKIVSLKTGSDKSDDKFESLWQSLPTIMKLGKEWEA